MLCQSCGKKEATTYLKRTVNGQTAETHLCGDCAAQQGADPFFTNWPGFSLGDFWGSLFSEPAARAKADTLRCEGCGHTFGEMARTGRAGCPVCYTTFYDRLLPSIQRIHGKTRHTGKLPDGAGESLRKERELDRLRRELNDCIAGQQCENCAALRDQIRTLEKDL